MKKIAVTAAVFLLAAVCSVGAVMLVQPEALSVRPITETSPCPVVGCASGSCHGFDDVPEPDGVHEMTCPEASCASGGVPWLGNPRLTLPPGIGCELEPVDTYAGGPCGGACWHRAEGGTLMRVLVVDALALVLYIVVSLPAMTGVGAHEWLGLGIGLVLLVHGAQHVDFAGRLLTSRGAWRAKGRILLDAALVLSVAVAVLSGLMESGTVLPAFGFYAEGYYFWGPLHAASAKVLLALLVVHGALNLGSAWRLAQRARAKEDE